MGRAASRTGDEGGALTFDEREYADGHDEYGHHEVSDGQRHEEVVGDILQTALPRDGQADEYVAGGRGQHQEHGQQGPPPIAAVQRHQAVAGRDAVADADAAGDVRLADERRRPRRLQRRVQRRRRRRRPGGVVANHRAAAYAVTSVTAAAATGVHGAAAADGPRSRRPRHGA